MNATRTETIGGCTLYLGDSLDVLPAISGVHACVTDPPYEIGFMGKSWDRTGIANNVALWSLVRSALLPGGHLLAFGGSRTYHRMACAIEDAALEIRDQIMWLYGSGFPKSRNLSGVWEGWGTALKPAHEPICMARKPFAGTVSQNVLTHGSGALNIDGSRVEVTDVAYARNCSGDRGHDGTRSKAERGATDLRPGGGTVASGRWPANVIHDGSDEVLSGFPITKSGIMRAGTRRAAQDEPGSVCYGTYGGNATTSDTIGDSGSAARFFYSAKASRSDRNEGCEGLEARPLHWSSGDANPGSFQSEGTNKTSPNSHPTVKPTELMRYLCRLVTPPSGIVLDPFMGSGSTGKAAALEGFRFIGIERDPHYFDIACRRIEAAVNKTGSSYGRTVLLIGAGAEFTREETGQPANDQMSLFEAG